MSYLNDQHYREINNILGTGYAAKSSVTSSIWINDQNVFAPKRDGNAIHAFTTGKAYFADLIEKIEGATKEICIAGWQINWDAMLAPGKRLYDVLLSAARKPGMKIYIMPWDDTRPVRTYDDPTLIVIDTINGEPGVAPGTVRGVVSHSFNRENAKYFSHHQKSVIIDRRYAYVGGIDVAYGRYDDEHYSLKCDAEGREVMNRYNPCIPPLKNVSMMDTVNPNAIFRSKRNPSAEQEKAYTQANGLPSELAKIKAGKWQVPYADPGFFDIASNGAGYDSPLRKTLDPARQPRMPWQDVHARVEGPCVYDFMRNFTKRWAVSNGAPIRFTEQPGDFPPVGSSMIQVLRTAPAGLVAKEDNSPLRGASLRQKEDHIKKAMLNLISKANHFIYIENQFFVGDLGRPVYAVPDDGGALSPAARFINTQKGKLSMYSEVGLRMTDDTKDAKKMYDPPTNEICKALVERIQRAILNEDPQPFHVYITLPVHPEGDFMTTASVAVQVFWTMQTISFGTNSLLNGIRRGLLAKRLRDQKKPYKHILLETQKDFGKELDEIPLEDCFDYVTLLNLRSWTKLGERYVTEQIYVHTKLMIVDDLYALFGSANINDRSLNGEGDSEIAVLVADKENARADICGDGVPRPVRNFAHKLRMDIWEKLFGISGNGSVQPGPKAASNLKMAIEKPGAPASWKAIQKQAEVNAAAYEKVFDYVPRNWSIQDGERVPCSIIPNWDVSRFNPDIQNAPLLEPYGFDSPTSTMEVQKAVKGAPSSLLPSEDKFWDKPHHDAQSVNSLALVAGFITALPIYWTKDEKNNFKYPTTLIGNVEENRERPIDSEKAGEMMTAGNSNLDDLNRGAV
ncbi:phospholipase D1/2 [Herbaspirillum rubrisubalbicans]|uniref:PLD phosphodiesterase domain-containing protein n=1 Tax=Herbaspirillum rubrisubalbicans Os34 TaxID=1235827 RepID=A0A6M3ZWE7_9BURK|nr:phospholipase D-like domain-containing protein [Herbaspirillum rubrisubalbicans]MCP1574551.1 phospholipase D1/2 [Herbaspirillum rubrisubalbicans]QJQ03019.1 hypothetical protein C798_23160 [Herbaspirillum rubrisubalbicans Os34]